MVKFVTVVCDRCKTPFIMDRFWTNDFVMDTGRDYCQNCVRIMKEGYK